MNLSRQVTFCTEGLQTYLNKGLQNEFFTAKFPKIFTKTVFFFKFYYWIGALKTQTNFFVKYQWMPLDGRKNDNIEKLVIVAK